MMFYLMKKALITVFISLFFSIFTYAFQVDAYNLRVGDSYQIVMNQSQNMSQTVMGSATNVNTQNESLELLEVIEITSNGDYTLKLTILEKKMVVSSPVYSLFEDSENPSVGTGLFAALKNTSYTFSMSNKGGIRQVSGLQDLKRELKSRLSGNREAIAQIDLYFNEELIRSSLEQRFSYFSTSNNRNWSTEQSNTMNAIPMDMTTNFTYRNNYTILAFSEITVETTESLFGTTADLSLSGNQNDTYVLNEFSGMARKIESSISISGTASTMGINVPMSIKTETKTTFTQL